MIKMMKLEIMNYMTFKIKKLNKNKLEMIF